MEPKKNLFLKLIYWISRTVEDETGTPDHTRATGFLFSFLIGYMVIYYNFNSWYKVAVFGIVVVGVMVLYKLVSAVNIIEFKNGFKKYEKKDTENIEK